MTRFLLNILVILMLWFPASSIADTPYSVYIDENDQGITIRVDDATLGEVLQSIEGKTGIQFHVSPSVLNDRIAINLNAPDWQTVMKKLLEPYGRMELWNPRLELTEIHVLSRADDSVSPQPQKQRKASASSPKLSRRQLLQLARGKSTAPLPPKLFDDPEIRAFLNQNDIHSLEEMKDTQKARSVRIKARRIMSQMSEAKQN
jgi:type II secretory pathway component GspD/PulD (secretin)